MQCGNNTHTHHCYQQWSRTHYSTPYTLWALTAAIILADAAVTPPSPKWPKMCRVWRWTSLNQPIRTNTAATASCRGHVDELASEPFLLLHREHGTGCRRSWNCCYRRIRFFVIWKLFCLILFTGTRIRIDSMIRLRSSIVAGAIQVPPIQLYSIITASETTYNRHFCTLVILTSNRTNIPCP